MPYGRKKNYHNKGRHFTNPDELAASEEKVKREREWKKKQGLEDSDSGEEDDQASSSKAKGKSRSHGAPGDLPPSDSEESYSDDDDEEDEREHRPKGVQHLIQVENPNHVKQKTKKITSLDTDDGKANLTRKQREELEKQQAHEKYMKAHLAGKTEEARADMARLAIIRKQREDAARKREEERLAQEAIKKEAEDKLLERRKNDRKK